MEIGSILGIVFVIISIRLIKNKLQELLFIGAVLGLLETLYFHGVKIGLPQLSNGFQLFTVWALVTYSVIRILDVLGMLVFPALRIPVKMIDGK